MPPFTCWPFIYVIPELTFGRQWLLGRFVIAPIVVVLSWWSLREVLFSRGLWSRTLPQIVVAMGLIFILNDVFKLVWGTRPKTD